MARSKNTPKVNAEFSTKKGPRMAASPSLCYLKEKLSWHVAKMDFSGQWGFGSLTEVALKRLYTEMASYETMTWDEILKATGGRSHGNNNHPIPCASLEREAQKRLCELRLDDIDELFSLRLTSTIRLWGIREGFYFKILWYDCKHEVYKIKK